MIRARSHAAPLELKQGMGVAGFTPFGKDNPCRERQPASSPTSIQYEITNFDLPGIAFLAPFGPTQRGVACGFYNDNQGVQTCLTCAWEDLLWKTLVEAWCSLETTC